MNPGWIAVGITGTSLILAHVIASVWWASKITTLQTMMRDTINEIKRDMDGFKAQCFTKVDAARELALSDKEHAAIWDKLDSIQNNPRKL